MVKNKVTTHSNCHPRGSKSLPLHKITDTGLMLKGSVNIKFQRYLSVPTWHYSACVKSKFKS